MEAVVLVGLLYVAFAVVPASIAVIPWRKRDSLGGLELTIAVLGAAGTALFHGLWLAVPALFPSPVLRMLLNAGFALSLEAATIGTLYLGVAYSGRQWLRQRRIAAAMATIGVVTALGGVAVQYSGQLPAPLVFQAANDGFTTVVSVVALAFFGEQFLDNRGVYRKQSGALFVGFGVATILGMLQAALRPPVFNFIPIGVTVGSGIIAWALFRFEVLETMPFARKMLFEHISDPVLAMDDGGYVVDHNDAATDLFGFAGTVRGHQVADLFPLTPMLVARHVDVLSDDDRVGAIVDGDQRHFDRDHPAVAALLDGTSLEEETTLGIYTDGTLQYFDVTRTPFESTPQAEGSLVVFRDVTEQKRREDELALLKEVLSRVLRHNLRNDITAIKGYADQIRTIGDDDVTELAEKILATSDDLVDTSRKARRIEDAIEAESSVVLPVADVVDSAVQSVRQEYPDAEYESTVPADVEVEAIPLLGLALTDVIENGVVHADREDPRVVVRAKPDGPWVEIVVSDNGPGIPQREVETLRKGSETALVHSSGAGLWLVHTIVEQSGGKIGYETDDGTTVRIYLQSATES